MKDKYLRVLTLITAAGITLLISEFQPGLEWTEDLFCAAERTSSVGKNIVDDLLLMLPVHLLMQLVSTT